MDRLSIVALAAVILKVASAPGFTDAGIPSGQEKKEREKVLRLALRRKNIHEEQNYCGEETGSKPEQTKCCHGAVS